MPISSAGAGFGLSDTEPENIRFVYWGPSHQVHVDVVVVRGVVDGFEEAVKLARGSSVDHQDERYSDWF